MANPAIVIDFLANTASLVSAVKDVDRASTATGKAVKKVDFGRIAKFAAGATALAAGAIYIKKSADATEELAKSTITLQRATGLDAESASAWVSTLETRGISVDAFQVSLVKLSRVMENARVKTAAAQKANIEYNKAAKELFPVIEKGGTAGKEATKELNKWGNAADKAARAADKATKPLTDLGVKFSDIKKGNINAVLLAVADGFQKIKNPAQLAATAQALFGRSGQKLLPILASGSEGIEKQLAMAEKYGAVVGEKQVKQIKQNAAAQKELQLAQKGVQIQIGSALLPAQVLLYGILVDVTRALAPLTDNIYVMTPAVILATAAWIGYKVAAIAATVASLPLNAALLITVGIVAAVVVGLILLGVAFVLAYKKIDWFRDIVDSTFAWIKRNWPLLLAILLGPIAVAAVLIVRNWDKITDGAREAVGVIKRVFGTVKAAVLAALAFGQAAWEVINNIGETITGFADTVRGWGRNIASWIKNAVVNGLVGIGEAAWKVIDNVGQWVIDKLATITGWGEKIGNAIRTGFGSAIEGFGGALVTAFKGAINTIIRLWNALEIPGFKVDMPKPIPDVKIPAIKFPNMALLAKGGIVTGPTLAMLGERGPEAVIPLSASGAPVEVRVFIGDTELKGLVRTEVRTENNRTAQTLLAGAI